MISEMSFKTFPRKPRNNNTNENIPKLGEIYYTNITGKNGSAQTNPRPCIVAQESHVIKNNSMVWVIPLTSKLKALHLPVHVVIKKDKRNNLKTDSVALVESMSYVSKDSLVFKIGEIAEEYFPMIGEAIRNQFPMSKERATA